MSITLNNSKQVQEEVSKLLDINFLLPGETINSIHTNFYQSETWAEVFWRRRRRHASREDPEVPFVFKQNPRTVLEIGAAYGRILKQLSEINDTRSLKADLTGIELCQFCKPYFQRYSQEYPSLQSCHMIYEDFLQTTTLKEQHFDVILLPMNTLPGFPYTLLKTLFITVKKYLSPNGLWIFSTHKLPEIKPLVEIINRRAGYFTELLGELGQEPIAIEGYQFKARETVYGVQVVSYTCYNTLTRAYKLKERKIYRFVKDETHPDVLKQLVKEQGFRVAFCDDSSHSLVYGLSPA